ncbi:hypothetical protein SDRG_13346 [Saprolegnia diclina VS20]|uniref:Uncharacterized protein n=1 Tax=Saprolegnia diclina (strain VS20) TaxID=1156394 RepID=T0Q388_SAPDV|nr:hypothetical protein SDRG_13346 [Saprolegnia diclina VS20]EQC29011.1 hypothetical protein SDRG_13346 [Saprolegnia diclina VS20]|eukprot:XP_008617650.1 hypothetical protein SDRG_13346 [Saprolegnia diclina VS20]
MLPALSASETIGVVVASVALVLVVAVAKLRHAAPTRRNSIWSSPDDELEDVRLLQAELRKAKAAKREPFFYPVLEETVAWWEEWQRKTKHHQDAVAPLCATDYHLHTTTLVTA